MSKTMSVPNRISIALCMYSKNNRNAIKYMYKKGGGGWDITRFSRERSVGKSSTAEFKGTLQEIKLIG